MREIEKERERERDECVRLQGIIITRVVGSGGSWALAMAFVLLPFTHHPPKRSNSGMAYWRIGMSPMRLTLTPI